MNNKRIQTIFIVILVSILFISNIILAYRNTCKSYENNYYNIKEFSLLNSRNELANKYILNEKIQVQMNENNILIEAQNILQNIDEDILGFKYSLDGLNYTSTIKPIEQYIFKHVKNINEISNIYIKVVDKKYNEILIAQYCTQGYKYEPYINIEVSTKEYTNTSVYVSVLSDNILDDNYIIYYKINNGEYNVYSSSLKIEENNTKITAIMYNKYKEKIEKQKEYIVTNIDNKKPSKPTNVDIYIKDNKIYIKAVGSKDDESGVLGYKYKINNEYLSDIIDKEYYYTHEINNIKEFKIEIISIDNVLNESETVEVHHSIN